MTTLQDEADRHNREREGNRVTTAEELLAVHARIGRVEADVKAQETKLGTVAEQVAWIKGYLEKQPKILGNGSVAPTAHMPRDAAMILGGGGGTGGLLFILEKLFGG